MEGMVVCSPVWIDGSGSRNWGAQAVAVASRQRAEGDRMVGKVEEACLSLYAYYCLFRQPNIKVEILIKKE
jgi:hypothetical protein